MDSTLLKLFKSKYERDAKTPGTHDCKSLFVEVMNHYGNNINVSDIETMAIEQVVAMKARDEYPYSEIDAKVIKKELASGKWKPLDKPEIGCAVVMAIDPMHPDLIQHLGVYIGEGKFIHILEDMGVLVSRVNDRFFSRKIRGFYKWNP